MNNRRAYAIGFFGALGVATAYVVIAIGIGFIVAVATIATSN